MENILEELRKLRVEFDDVKYSYDVRLDALEKEMPLKEFPDHFRTHMFHIHKQYTDELKPKNEYVNNTVVIKYVNNLDPSLQMYSLNACLRKRQVDFVKVDSTAD